MDRLYRVALVRADALTVKERIGAEVRFAAELERHFFTEEHMLAGLRAWHAGNAGQALSAAERDAAESFRSAYQHAMAVATRELQLGLDGTFVVAEAQQTA